MSTEKRRIKWRLAKRKQRAEKRAEQKLRKISELNKPEAQVEIQKNRNYKREHPNEYCPQCGKHRFYCECEPEKEQECCWRFPI